MKHILFKSLILILLLVAVDVKAQDCHALVLPRYGYNDNAVQSLPTEKLETLCRYAKTVLFVTNEAPEDAIVYDISVIKNARSGETLSMDVVIDTNTFSFWAYNFSYYHAHHFNHRVYFRTPNSEYKYLVLRSANEADILSSETPDYERARQYAH